MKEKLDKQAIALRAAKELRDGTYVNLGFGIPLLVSNMIPENKTIFFHAENGILGYGEDDPEGDPYVLPAGFTPVKPMAGMCYFDTCTSHAMIRGGYLETILGALQVSATGDLANWKVPGQKLGVVGGAMDIAANSKRVIICMEHVSKKGELRILNKCSYPLTAKECVDLIISDMAVIEVTKEGLILREFAPGFTVEDIQAATEPRLRIAKDLKEIEL